MLLRAASRRFSSATAGPLRPTPRRFDKETLKRNTTRDTRSSVLRRASTSKEAEVEAFQK